MASKMNADISKALKGINKSMNINMMQTSPQMIMYSTAALIVMSVFIYIGIKFFKKYRFRGISLGIFTKSISLNKYIEDFNKMIFEDFSNIHHYYQMRTDMNIPDSLKSKTSFTDSANIIREIANFMKDFRSEEGDISYKQFSAYLKAFFQPNPSFQLSKDDIVNNGKKEKLKTIFRSLYQKKFHNEFDKWINYKSIWNFVRNDDENVHDVLFKQELSDENKPLASFIKKLQTKELSYEDLIKVNEIFKTDITNQIINVFDKQLDAESTKNLKQIFFKRTSNNRYENIKDFLKQNYSRIDIKSTDMLIENLESKGFTAEKLKYLNSVLSFVDTLTKLSANKYIVRSDLKNTTNNSFLESEFEKSKSVSEQMEKTMLIYNACFKLSNELLFFKYESDEKTKFLFHNEQNVVNENNLHKNDMWKSIQTFFNIHLVNMYFEEINAAKQYIDINPSEDSIDLSMETHVSISRLKYLIQDYFVIINEYNDKNNPDKNDIKEFWEKRVNAFGFRITKSNSPEDGNDDLYTKHIQDLKNNSSISKNVAYDENDDMFNKKSGYILKKNTPWFLYKHYLKSLFEGPRHPNIPLFHTMIAYIRYFIPDPNVVLNNFMDQLNGKTPPETESNIKADFSFHYDPNINILSNKESYGGSIEEQAGTINTGLENHDNENIGSSANKTESSTKSNGNAGAGSLR